MNLALAAANVPHPMHHYMQPWVAFTVLLVGGLLDYWAIGSDSYRDRAAFLCYTTSIYEGFNGGPVDVWTLDKLRQGLSYALSTPALKGSYIGGAALGLNWILHFLVIAAFVYAFVCILPKPIQARLAKSKYGGAWLVRDFPSTTQGSRFNKKLIILAVFLGLFIDLPQGPAGDFFFWLFGLGDQLVNWAFTSWNGQGV